MYWHVSHEAFVEVEAETETEALMKAAEAFRVQMTNCEGLIAWKLDTTVTWCPSCRWEYQGYPAGGACPTPGCLTPLEVKHA